MLWLSPQVLRLIDGGGVGDLPFSRGVTSPPFASLHVKIDHYARSRLAPRIEQIKETLPLALSKLVSVAALHRQRLSHGELHGLGENAAIAA
jgi:hypothetical protein